MAKNLVLAWTFMCPFFFMGLHMPYLFFFNTQLMPLLGKIWGRLYRMWSIKGNKWIVWKCYPSSVEVLANGGSVYVILDHESMKRNS